jgi:hypothetical protein
MPSHFDMTPIQVFLPPSAAARQSGGGRWKTASEARVDTCLHVRRPLSIACGTLNHARD